MSQKTLHLDARQVFGNSSETSEDEDEDEDEREIFEYPTQIAENPYRYSNPSPFLRTRGCSPRLANILPPQLYGPFHAPLQPDTMPYMRGNFLPSFYNQEGSNDEPTVRPHTIFTDEPIQFMGNLSRIRTITERPWDSEAGAYEDAPPRPPSASPVLRFTPMPSSPIQFGGEDPGPGEYCTE